MEDRTFSTNNHPTDGISDTFRQFIEALVEEVVINGESFEAQKKWLRKHSEAEGLNYETIESNLNDFFEAIKELEEHESKFVERSVRALAKEYYFSEALVNQLLDHAAAVRTQKEFDRKAQEEKERKAQEENERKAKEEAERKKRKRAETERKAKEEAERRAREEAERIAKEESEKKQTTGELNGHKWVDLGLPSGTLWATCNIGASKPEDYGDYFAWGETKTKSVYNWSTYKYANGDYDKLTKYCTGSGWGNNGFTDNLTELQSSDDPANSNWGSGWRAPSKAEWDELLRNTTNEWTTLNGKEGRLFTSKKNGQTLFLPAAGYRWDSELLSAGSNGRYWSSSLNTDRPNNAWRLNVYSGGCGMHYDGRYNGHSVRPVRQN